MTEEPHATTWKCGSWIKRSETHLHVVIGFPPCYKGFEQLEAAKVWTLSQAFTDLSSHLFSNTVMATVVSRVLQRNIGL